MYCAYTKVQNVRSRLYDVSVLLSYFTISKVIKTLFGFLFFVPFPHHRSSIWSLFCFSIWCNIHFIYQRWKLEERKIRPNDDGYGDDDDENDDDDDDVEHEDDGNGKQRSTDANRETIDNDDLTRSNGFCIWKCSHSIMAWNVNEFIIHTQLTFLFFFFFFLNSIEERHKNTKQHHYCVRGVGRCDAQQVVMYLKWTHCMRIRFQFDSCGMVDCRFQLIFLWLMMIKCEIRYSRGMRFTIRALTHTFTHILLHAQYKRFYDSHTFLIYSNFVSFILFSLDF